ncbi:MAG: tryptophan-rich sensory protein [Clostridia bacterium]|nr:tryptophan-rich sensory protein [Clostridia bacterium]
MNKQKIIDYVIVILPIAIVAGLGTLFSNLGMSWFDTLAKPTQWVPDWIFPVVWSVIYIAFAVFLIVWQNKEPIARSTIVWLVVNGVLNILWCLVFFTLHLTLLGNVVIILNLIASFCLLNNIAEKKKSYPLILLIYPLWLSVATTLNLAVWILN